MKSRVRFRDNARLFVLAILFILAAVQPPQVLSQTQINATMTLDVADAQVRTLSDILQSTASRMVANQEPVVPFRPTISDAQYQQAKAAATSAGVGRSTARPQQ